ncbi:MAG: hypothetical protein HY774_11350 [Acidobacteria bacterium]|nr:hypothetical protein [Acidobacteriota bacterium]
MRFSHQARKFLAGMILVGMCGWSTVPALSQTNSAKPQKIKKKKAVSPDEYSDSETDRAFQLEKDADLVVGLEGHWIWVIQPGKPPKKAMNEEYLIAALPFLDLKKKDLVVVVFGKLFNGQYLRVERGDVMDQLEKAFLENGFKKIVFQQGTATGRPILRETERKP